MNACMLEHPHHFDNKKENEKKEKERERGRKIMERLYDSPLG